MSRKKQNWENTRRRFDRSRKSGWNRDLYLNKQDSIIGGVCSGLGDYFGRANWVVRVLFVLGLLVFDGAMIVAYILLWIILSPRSNEGEEGQGTQDEGVFRTMSSVRLRRTQQRLRRAKSRVENMEAYVTSRQYELNKEFAKMEK